MRDPTRDDLKVILKSRMENAGFKDYDAKELNEWVDWLIKTQHVTKETIFDRPPEIYVTANSDVKL